jgi:hypothetical protein
MHDLPHDAAHVRHQAHALSYVSFLDAFAILRKATIVFVVSVCLSVRLEQFGSHRTDFREI